MSFIFHVAQTFGIDTNRTLVRRNSPCQCFFVTRKGKGISVEKNKKRTNIRHWEPDFSGNRAELFEVTVEPNDEPMTLNTHTGQGI